MIDSEFLKKLLLYIGISVAAFIVVLIIAAVEKKINLSALVIITFFISAFAASAITAFFDYWLSFHNLVRSEFMQFKLTSAVYMLLLGCIFLIFAMIFNMFPQQ